MPNAPETKWTKGELRIGSLSFDGPRQLQLEIWTDQKDVDPETINGGYIIAEFYGPDADANSTLYMAAAAMYQGLLEMRQRHDELAQRNGYGSSRKVESCGCIDCDKAGALMRLARGEASITKETK